MTLTTTFILSSLGGYFLGSIPFGLVLTRLAGTEDIRKIGSGSIGATNVLRTGRKDLAFLTLICDAFKAGFAAWLAYHFIAPLPVVSFGYISSANTVGALLAGSCGVIGHNYPIWLKFKGGKGVASAFGFFLVMSPTVAISAFGVWLLMAVTFRYSSLSALTAAVSVPILAFFMLSPVYTIFYTAIAVLVIVNHHSNIVRLIKGQESKIKFKKQADGKN